MTQWGGQKGEVEGGGARGDPQGVGSKRVGLRGVGLGGGKGPKGWALGDGP